jgi:A nuclease family of the HNH/ENDO VII superfamily with conserved AHH
MQDAATGKDLLTQEKLNEEERVSRGDQGVLGVAGSFSLLEDTGKNIINGAKGIPRAAEGLAQKAMGGSPELALPNGGNDPKNPPPGYRYQVRNGRPELVRGSKEGPYPPLTVENGIVYLQTGKTNRLSVFSRYKKNYLDWVEQTQGKAARTAAEQRIKDGNQLHHLTPDAVVRENELTRELMRRSKTYTLDRGTNILDMTTLHNPKTREIVHLGSHKKFNDYVSGLLNKKVDILTGDGAIPLAKVKVENLDKAVRQVEDTLRSQIRNRTLPSDILELLEGGGYRISEKPEQLQGGATA